MSRNKFRLSVNLTDDQVRALDSVKDFLRNDSKVQAFGFPVNDHTALRYILYESLDGHAYISRGLEREEQPLPSRESFGDEVAHAQESKVESADQGTPEHDNEDVLPVKVYDRPVGWEYYDQGGWEFPGSQDEMHAYYEAAGWLRCAAQLEDRMLELYWHPDGAEQNLPPFPGRDSYNRGVDVQRSPDVGVAHMGPEDWEEPRGATGDIGTWSPG